ncbi:hypothetical protein HYC85_009478 [Camellia sinensis]|uniref:Uncharacterized protein n=1 Tax=Camellia sinensis TaxID=4442 RepID=A0A7J7HHS8_CAMSI|nr:hypothetical protein HYC85_009478 [Camellia sinensis]
MRIADILTSNWNYVWAIDIMFLKSLQLVGLFSPLEGRVSTLILFVFSAASTFILIFLTRLVDAITILHFSSDPVCIKSCKGGICWHSFPQLP